MRTANSARRCCQSNSVPVASIQHDDEDRDVFLLGCLEQSGQFFALNELRGEEVSADQENDCTG